jgi:hypothetical protein
LALAPGMVLPIRMTILRDRDGGLTLVSPVDGVAQWGPLVSALGPVRRIVAPSGLHHLFALQALAQFGGAELWASAALRDKRKDFPAATRWLEGDGVVQLTADLVLLPVAGMPDVQEWLLFHRPSATLVVTDLLFHLLEPSFLFGLMLRLFGTYKRLAVSRLFLRACRDRDALARSLQAVVALPVERLVMAHGEPLLSNAAEPTREALAGCLIRP